MTSEIRANKQTNRVGLGTVTYTDTGIIVSGIVTANSLGGIGHINVGSNIQLGNAGIVTATSFVGSGANLTGITQTTINNNAANKVIMGSNTANTLEAVAKNTLFQHLNHGQNFLDDQYLIFGDASDLQLLHQSSGAKSRIRNTNDSGSLDIESTLTRFTNKDGSTEKLRIDSNGYLGVGLDDPHLYYSPDLVVKASAANGGITIRSAATTHNNYLMFADGNSGDSRYDGYIKYNHNTRQFDFATATATRFSITSGGYIKVKGDQGNQDYWGQFYNRSDGFSFHAADGSVQRNFTFYSGASTSTERLRITSTGEVNIGNGAGYSIWNTVANDQRCRLQLKQTGGDHRGVAFLEERGDANGMDVFISKSRGGNGVGAINSGDTLGFLKWSGADGTRQHNAAGILGWNNGTIATGRVAGNLSFYTSPDAVGSLTERLRINSSGQVIIAPGGSGGTADTNADNFVVKNYTSSASCGISILNSDSQNSVLYFGNASDSKHAEIVWSDASNIFLIGSSNAGASLKFRTADQQDALLIDSSGNLGVNCTPVSIFSAYKSIQLNNYGIWQADDGGGSFLSNNAYINSSANWTYMANDYASDFGMDDGNFYFRNAGSGTGTISWNMPLKIQRNNRINIGEGNSGTALGALHINTSTVMGTETALWVGDNSANRYMTINQNGNTEQFSHMYLRFDDNGTRAVLQLVNRYATGTGYGTQIKFRGNNDEQTGAIKCQNITSGSSNADLSFTVNNSDKEVLRLQSNGDGRFYNGLSINKYDNDYSGFTRSGLVLSTPAYNEYQFTWSGHASKTIDFTCGSYFHSEFIYTQHQTNGGHHMHHYVRGKWANNHYTHTGFIYEHSGNGGGTQVSFTASDTSGNGAVDMKGGLTEVGSPGATYRHRSGGGAEGTSSSATGRFRIVETYNNGSLSTRCVILRIYFGSLSGASIS
mgnify:CR=1 FL=1